MQHDEQRPYKPLIPIKKNILEMKVLLRWPFVSICNAIRYIYQKIIIIIMNYNVALVAISLTLSLPKQALLACPLRTPSK